MYIVLNTSLFYKYSEYFHKMQVSKVSFTYSAKTTMCEFHHFSPVLFICLHYVYKLAYP